MERSDQAEAWWMNTSTRCAQNAAQHCCTALCLRLMVQWMHSCNALRPAAKAQRVAGVVPDMLAVSHASSCSAWHQVACPELGHKPAASSCVMPNRRAACSHLSG